MKRLAILLGLAVVALGLLGVSSASNRPLAGDLDPSFGNGGRVITAENTSYASGIAVQPDGKIVVAGTNVDDTGVRIAVARYLPDGSLDPDFAGGLVKTPIGPDSQGSASDALVVQPDGKILVAAHTWSSSSDYWDVALLRYNPDGSLDSTFGTDGIATSSIGPHPTPSAVLLQPDGRIVVVGSTNYERAQLALLRYLPNGSPDPTFGTSGKVTTSFGWNFSASSAALQPDGKIVAGGTASVLRNHNISSDEFGLVRYKPDGSLDPSFGKAGKATGPPGSFRLGGIARQNDGKIVAVGGAVRNGRSAFALVQFNRDGRKDPSFGLVTTRVPGHFASAYAVALQPDGNIVAAGASLKGPKGFTLIRYHPSGAVDRSFGVRGIVTTELWPGAPGFASAVVVQQDGKIVAIGDDRLHNDQPNAWAVIRYLGGSNCAVPGVRGKRLTRAKATIRLSYCRIGHVAKRFSAKVGKGRVISQAPGSGTRLPAGSKVNLVVSKGKR